MSSSFSTQVLSEKLTKLNNSQQSIETLSNWCIFHRKKARQVVETWEKLFNSSQKDKRVSFLYLANDILQNSRRKGSEFVNEFWKVLPGTLRSVSEDGDENGKNVVARLVDIWEQRKVFGSRGKSLKEEMSSKEPPPLLENNGVSSHSVKVGRKDAHTIRVKLIVGSMPEKIVTAFQSVHDEHFNEDTALNKCKTAVRRVAKMEKDVDDTCAQGNQGSQLVDELEEQETVLKQSIEQLKGIEATRSALVDLLKEAIQEQVISQESKMELLRNQLQVAENESEHASKMKQRLTSSTAPTIETMASTIPTETLTTLEPNPSPLQTPITTPRPPLPPQPINSFINSLTTTDDQQNKAAAAAIAAKLAASTSSAQMLSSVLSSLAAEEAASASITKTSGFTMSSPMYPLEKRPKLEKPYFDR
ncbi:hypothetical protein QJS10_CPA05g00668 [Acorus calamus]|uniref:CID domain-containing protein n=1 Tax=Acorus calamus TaxID=4465 RepID=A0AAV9EUA8_ACOCL|nr:hypothetical protein QJS10_CPA05g00668 [Acorus calamus]